MKRLPYLCMDYAAATPLRPRVLRAMVKALSLWGNPSSLHAYGIAAAGALEEARKQIAHCINCKPDEVVFVSGGTEANVLAIAGTLDAALAVAGIKNVSAITSSIEHPSVLETFRAYEKKGVRVSYVQPTPDGLITSKAVTDCVRPDTALVSLALVNSEIGTTIKAADIARDVGESVAKFPEASRFPVRMHFDAAQAPLWMAIQRDALRADLLSFDSAKIGGPKGFGVLVVKRGITLAPRLYGGSQEGQRRAGTQNVPAAVGCAVAFEEAVAARFAVSKRVASLRDVLWREIQREFPSAVVNGSMQYRVANNLNVSIPSMTSELSVLALDALGVGISAGTACAAAEGPSAVVAAIAPTQPWRAACALRFTLWEKTTTGDIQRAVRALRKCFPFVSASVVNT